MKTHYRDLRAYETRDGSTIRELMHPGGQAADGGNQSLAEARVSPGSRTLAHRHLRSEEIYHISAGTGRMCLDGEWFDVTAGDTVLIPPGTMHCLDNPGDTDLVVLCCCAPPYSHEDTELLNSTRP